jgi:hypothetical protein
MPEESEKEKLKILLNHWIEHNRGHAEEFRQWAEKAKKLGQAAVYDDMMQAAQQMNKANEFLLAALDRARVNVSGKGLSGWKRPKRTSSRRSGAHRNQ